MVPAPGQSNSGSKTFSTNDFHPVCVCDARPAAATRQEIERSRGRRRRPPAAHSRPARGRSSAQLHHGVAQPECPTQVRRHVVDRLVLRAPAAAGSSSMRSWMVSLVNRAARRRMYRRAHPLDDFGLARRNIELAVRLTSPVIGDVVMRVVSLTKSSRRPPLRRRVERDATAAVALTRRWRRARRSATARAGLRPARAWCRRWCHRRWRRSRRRAETWRRPATDRNPSCGSCPLVRMCSSGPRNPFGVQRAADALDGGEVGIEHELAVDRREARLVGRPRSERAYGCDLAGGRRIAERRLERHGAAELEILEADASQLEHARPLALALRPIVSRLSSVTSSRM